MVFFLSDTFFGHLLSNDILDRQIIFTIVNDL